MPELFERVAIVGVGLIGGSLALAGRQAGLIGQVIGVGRSEENLAVARQRGIVDRSTRDVADIGPVDLVVLAMPLRSTETVARALLPHLRPGTVVTDVGSVKGPVVAAMEALLPPDRPFVGAHPIAGTEHSGAAAADAGLFRGSRCVLTPTPRTDERALARVEELWRGTGARVERMAPARHDQTLAWTSHLVHAIAYSLALAIEKRDPELFAFAGPSLRDATRVAASSPEMWRDILLENSGAVGDVIREFADGLERFREAVAGCDEAELESLLRAGRAARKRLEAMQR